MQNLHTIKARILESNPDYFQLCSDFLILYSRLEYALKESGFLQNGANALASLDKFCANILEDFDPSANEVLRHAVDFILNEPPRRLLRIDDRLEWQVNIVDKSLELQLAEYIRRTRNNLMHGGKFYGQIDTGGRNWMLISSAMIIIENWIDLNEEVKTRFREL